MRKREQRLWDRMRANLPPDILAERIENIVAVGMPDVIVNCAGVVSWIELKAVDDIPARPGTPVLGNVNGLSAEQRNWHHRWRTHGGNTFVLIGIGSEQLLLPGTTADVVNGMSFEQLALASIGATWDEIAAQIRVEV